MANKRVARLSIDVTPSFRTRLKIAAARKGTSLRGYCVEAVERRLEQEEPQEEQGEGIAWARLAARSFARDWDSKEDCIYDNI